MHGRAVPADGSSVGSRRYHGFENPTSLTTEGNMLKALGRKMVRSRLTRAMKFGSAEEGVSMAEYALLLALIAMVVLVAASVLGTKISSFFVSAAAAI